MGCQSIVQLADNLTFTICTHDPDTGVLTDADGAPDYRVYEDETATAILTGTMAKLDDANTTGFYSEQIACTAANGFEAGKSYNIFIAATVDGDTGGISYGFTIAVKTGYALAAAGLDACTIADADDLSGSPVRTLLRKLKWFFNKHKIDKTTTPDQLLYLKDDNSTTGLSYTLAEDSNEVTRTPI